MAERIDYGIPDVMSMSEVADLHGVSRQAVHKWITSGMLPARRAGRAWIVRRDVAEGLTVDGEVITTEVDTPPRH